MKIREGERERNGNKNIAKKKIFNAEQRWKASVFVFNEHFMWNNMQHDDVSPAIMWAECE